MTREIAIDTRRLADRSTVLIATASATLLLAAALGARIVLHPAARGPAPGIHLPLAPLPSASAAVSPPAMARAHGKHPAPVRSTASAPAPARSVIAPAPGAAPSAASSPAAAGTQQEVAVRYLVLARSGGGYQSEGGGYQSEGGGYQSEGGGYQFEGEVRVVNDGPAPIPDWRIAVALPYDQITAIWGASGYVSNHILLMQPGPGAGALASGGQLSVFFTADGPETTPVFCAFDDTTCG
jgi:hypothetical protein